MFSGNKLLNSFELACGYQPSVVGLPRTVVIQDLLDARKEQVAIRKLQRLLYSRTYLEQKPHLFNPDDHVWVFFKTSEQNEAVEWLPATVLLRIRTI